MNALFKDLLFSFSSTEEAPLSEVKYLLAQIEETKIKMACAWNHLDYADPEYVEIAVIELLLAQTQYSLLHKRYRLLLGIKHNPSFCTLAATKKSSISLEENL